MAVDNTAEPAETKFLGFLLNGCTNLWSSSTSPRFRVEIDEIYAPKFKQEEMYEDILIYSQGFYFLYFLVYMLVLKHDMPDSV